MAIDVTPDELPGVQQEVQTVVDAVSGRHWPMGVLERFAFYDAARGCYAVVLTGERRLYGNVLIKKGAIPPESY
jgi:L-fucose mutarotase